MIDGTWFLLYDGTSEDGMGTPHYCGRTKDKEIAKFHYEKCKENPYTIGKVVAITDTREIHINWETHFVEVYTEGEANLYKGVLEYSYPDYVSYGQGGYYD